VCIDFAYAIHIGSFLQCRTLHCKTMRVPINMLETPLTHGLSSIRIHFYPNHGHMDCLASKIGIMWIVQNDKHSCHMLLCTRCQISSLLQLNVMHNLNKIANWHVCSLDVVNVLHIQAKKNPQKWNNSKDEKKIILHNLWKKFLHESWTPLDWKCQKLS
jgi:hypothetical protein